MIDQAILIRDKTRLEQLIERFNSKAQARFYIERSGGNFEPYEQEHKQFYLSLDTVIKTLNRKLRYKVIMRSFIPSFIFAKNQVVVVLGQDGLVANTAKYVDNIPIIGVNPDPDRYDGILLPFHKRTLVSALDKVLRDAHHAKYVTMAEAKLGDGQRMLAFNDLFIGMASHRSSRYQLHFQNQKETQSSSGILISTGAGSTGWLSSVFHMAQSVNQLANTSAEIVPTTLPWDTHELLFVVREPFLSKHSSVSLTAGKIGKNQPLEIESFMPGEGVIFSDGIENDFLRFNSGSIAQIGIAPEKACLVVAN
jgi:NAD kinase